MGLLARVREAWAASGQDRVIARIISTWMAARPLAQPHDYRRLADEGYRQNTLVFGCVEEIATSAAEPRLVVGRKRSDGTIDLVPKGTDAKLAQRLFDRPNREQSTYEWLAQMLCDALIFGNWYDHMMLAPMGNVAELWNLRPHRVNIKPDANGLVERYDYTIHGSGIKEPIPAEEVVHGILHPDPLDDYYGLSPIAVLARWGDLDNMAVDYLRAFFGNAGAPAGLLKLKNRVNPGERQRIKDAWKEAHQGKEAWHSVSVLDADAEYQELGSRPEKLRMSTITENSESRICMAFGVPPILVGALIGLERSTFANYAEARKSFWMETLSPMYRRIADRLTHGVVQPHFGEDLVVVFDTSHVEALQEAKKDRRDALAKGWDGGAVKLNEYREALGLPADEDPELGDGYKQNPLAGLGLLPPDNAQKFLRLRPRERQRVLVRAAQLALNASPEEQRELDRTAEWEGFVRRFATAEDEYAAAVEEALNAGRDALVAEVRGAGVDAELAVLQAKLQPRLEEIAKAKLPGILERGFKRGIRQINTRAQQTAGGPRETHAPKPAPRVEVDFNLEIPRIADYLRARPIRYASLIVESLAPAMRDVIAAQTQTGASIDQIADAVSDSFDDITPTRARTIARTEVISAANTATVTAYQEAGVVEEHEWLSSRDERVRPSHMEADGQVTDVDGGVFSVGGSTLQYPGDPSGPVEEIVNCRCTVLPVIKTDQAAVRSRREFRDGMEQLAAAARAIAERPQPPAPVVQVAVAAPIVQVAPPMVQVAAPNVVVHVPPPVPLETEVLRDEHGRMTGSVQRPIR